MLKKKLEKQTLLDIIEEARLSPSACNSQPYKIFAIQGEKAQIVANARLAGMNKFLTDCSSFIVIAEDKQNIIANIGGKISHNDFRSIDIGILTANIANSAEAKNVQTCIIGSFSEKELLSKLKINEKIRLIIALGYETQNYPNRKKNRKEQSKIVTYLD